MLDALDREHSSLIPIESNPSFKKDTTYLSISPERQKQIDLALQEYPLPHNATLPEKLPHYVAVSYYKDKPFPEKNAVGVISLSGITGSALGNVHTSAAISEEYKRQTGQEFNLISALTSPVSVDTRKDSFSTDPVVRATLLANVIVDVLQTHPPLKELYLLGFSMGAMDVGFAYPIIESLLKQNKIDTKIGLIFSQPGGQIDQGSAKLGYNFFRAISFEPEYKGMFPTIFDIEEKRRELEVAISQGDSARVFELKDIIEKMKEKNNNPSYLSGSSLGEYKELEHDLRGALASGDTKVVNDLLAKRRELLAPVVKKRSLGAETRSESFNPVHVGQFGLNQVVLSGGRGVVDVLDSRLRQSITAPTAVLFGTRDDLFPESEAAKTFEDTTKESPYPNTHLFYGRVEGLSHAQNATEEQPYAKIASDVIHRMHEDLVKSENGQDASDEVGTITKLRYSI